MGVVALRLVLMLGTHATISSDSMHAKNQKNGSKIPEKRDHTKSLGSLHCTLLQ